MTAAHTTDTPMNATISENDDDLPAEIGFGGGTRGKFHRPNARLNLPLYLDAELCAALVALAARKGTTLSDLVNELLKDGLAFQATAILNLPRSD
jgi:hypothetical protein